MGDLKDGFDELKGRHRQACWTLPRKIHWVISRTEMEILPPQRVHTATNASNPEAPRNSALLVK